MDKQMLAAQVRKLKKRKEMQSLQKKNFSNKSNKSGSGNYFISRNRAHSTSFSTVSADTSMILSSAEILSQSALYQNMRRDHYQAFPSQSFP